MDRKHIKNYKKVLAGIRKWRKAELADARKTLRESKAALADTEHWEGDIYTWPLEVKPTSDGEPLSMTRSDIEHRLKWAQEHKPFVEELIVKSIKRLEAADKAGVVEELKFVVNWKKSRTWGSNPRCDLWACISDEQGNDSCYVQSSSIGGCGYDKCSTAMQEAMDKLSGKFKAALDRLVIEHGDKLWNEYAIYKRPFPQFEIAGKGVSTFTHLFPRFGYKQYKDNYVLSDYVLDEERSPESSDVFHVVKRSIA